MKGLLIKMKRILFGNVILLYFTVERGKTNAQTFRGFCFISFGVIQYFFNMIFFYSSQR